MNWRCVRVGWKNCVPGFSALCRQVSADIFLLWMVMSISAAPGYNTIRKLIDEAREALETDPRRARLLAGEARALALALPGTNSALLADALFVLAESAQKEEQYDDVVTYATEAARFFDEAGNNEQYMESLNVTGKALWNKGEYTTALDVFMRLLTHAKATGSTERGGRTQSNIGVLYWYFGEYDKALDYLQHALQVAELCRDTTWINSTRMNIGNVYANTGDDVRALEYLYKGFAEAEKNTPGATAVIASFLMNIANVFHRMGDYGQALEYHLRSLALREEIGARQYIATSLMNIGIVYKENGQNEFGLNYLLRGLDMYNDIGAEGEKSRCLVNLANVENSLGHPDAAQQYAEQCLGICANNGDKRTASYALHTLGRVWYIRGDNDTALNLFRQSRDICREIAYSKGEISGNVEMSRIYSAQQRYDESLACLQQALELTTTTSQKPLLVIVYRALGELYETIGDTGKALGYFRSFYETEKEIFNENSERRFQMLRILHQVKEAQKEADIYRLKSEQLGQEVDAQKKELATKAMYLSQRSDFLHKLKKDILKVMDAQAREMRSQMQELVRHIDATLSDEQTWNAFEEQFKQVHHTFVEALKEQYPGLSATELKVCALIKINLSSKEICRVLNVSPRSVDIYRHRIRKKIGLSSEENLASFLAGLH